MRISALLAIAACTPVQPEPVATPAPVPVPVAAPVVAPVVAPAPAPRVPAVWMPLELDCPKGQEHCARALAVDMVTGVVLPLDPQPQMAGPIRADAELVVWESHVSGAAIFARNRRGEPVALQWPGGRVRALELDARAVWVVDEEGLLRLPRDGGPAERLVVHADLYGVAPGEPYATLAAGETVLHGAGGPLRTFPGKPGAVAVAAGTLLWAEFGGDDHVPARGSVRAWRPGEPAPRVLATQEIAPRVLAADATHVYWVCDQPEGRALRRVAHAGGEVHQLGRSLGVYGVRGNHDRLDLADGFAYWNTGHAVVRVPVAGGTLEVVARARQPGDIVDFDVQGEHLYLAVAAYDATPDRRLPPR